MKLKGVVNVANKQSVTNGDDGAYDGKNVLVLGFGQRDGYSGTESCAYCAFEENGKTKVRAFNVANIVITDKLF